MKKTREKGGEAFVGEGMGMKGGAVGRTTTRIVGNCEWIRGARNVALISGFVVTKSESADEAIDHIYIFLASKIQTFFEKNHALVNQA